MDLGIQLKSSGPFRSGETIYGTVFAQCIATVPALELFLSVSLMEKVRISQAVTYSAGDQMGAAHSEYTTREVQFKEVICLWTATSSQTFPKGVYYFPFVI